MMRVAAAFGLGLCLILAGCKFVPTAGKNGAPATSGGASDPDAQVAAMWAAKVLPYLESKAGKFVEVRTLAAASPDDAGKKYGHKEKEGSAPWTMVVHLDGKIVAANTESRAGSFDVDADGDGQPDARVQMGPVIRGTALRDSLDFVAFSQFTNQIDFAQFGKAFNSYVDKTMASKLPRTELIGKHVSVLGAYPLPGPGEIPLVTAAKIELK